MFKQLKMDKKSTYGHGNSKEKEWHINVKETLAVWLGISTFARDLRDCSIWCRIDNTTAVAYVNHQSGMRSSECDIIGRDIWGFCQERNLWIIVVHIPGVDNVEADHESRIKPNVQWEIPEGVFDSIEKLLGPFDIDLFASRLRLSNLTSR